MFSYVDLKYDYTIEALPNTTISQSLVTGYDDSVKITQYNIVTDAERLVTFSIYETGLAIYTELTADKSILKSNMPFISGNDGKLHLSV